MKLSEKSDRVRMMFDKIAPRYELLNKILSFGQDRLWRHAIIKNLPKKAADSNQMTLYDIATGTGDVLFECLQKRPDYHELIGMDISEGMLSQAKSRLEKIKAKNKETTLKQTVHFSQASAEKIPAKDHSANAVTISFGFRNVENREKALQEFYRVLKPGGKLFILDFFNPDNSLMNQLYLFYFRKVLPKIGGLFSDKEAYEYLPQSVSSMPTSKELQTSLLSVGFSHPKEVKWLAGTTRLFIAEKK